MDVSGTGGLFSSVPDRRSVPAYLLGDGTGNGPMISLRPSLITEYHSVSRRNDPAGEAELSSFHDCPINVEANRAAGLATPLGYLDERIADSLEQDGRCPVRPTGQAASSVTCFCRHDNSTSRSAAGRRASASRRAW
jgi:hypothetical protein